MCPMETSDKGSAKGRKDVIDAIKADKLFNFISMYGADLSKNDLISILKEHIYAVNRDNDVDKGTLNNYLTSELSNLWHLGEDE